MQIALYGGTPVRDIANPFPAWPSFSEETIRMVQEPLITGKVNYWTGEYGKKFEKAFSDYCGVKYSYCLNSATSGLFLALLACNIGPGDEVIVPSYTFVATASSVLMANAIPVFADIDPDTYTISGESIEEHLTSRTKAIIPVHLNGHPAEMDSIMNIARKNNLRVIEDASQALGAKYKGKPVGSIGDIGVFSFCQDKTITTGGEGGMAVTEDPVLAEIIGSLRSHGFKSAGKRGFIESQRVYPYIFERIGYNFRMTEIQSIIGLSEMSRLDSWNLANRRRNANLLTELLKDLDEVITPVIKDGIEHGYYKYPLQLRDECLNGDRAEIIRAIAAEGLTVEPGDTADNYRQGIFSNLRNYNKTCPFSCSHNEGFKGYKEISLPVSEKIGKKIIRVRVHPNLSPQDIDDTALIIKKVISYFSKQNSKI